MSDLEQLTDSQIEERLTLTFYPYAAAEIQRARTSNVRFVHYTSAENGLNILNGNCVWLRNSTLMNDFSEVRHGIDCLNHAWNKPDLAGRLKAVLESLFPGAADKLQYTFNEGVGQLTNESYLLSISEHGDVVEDLYGRLSMWRAYCQGSGVALVFNNKPFLSPTDAINAFTTPVLYADKWLFESHFGEMVDRIEGQTEFMRFVGEQVVFDNLLEAFVQAALATKHVGFREEAEWRVIYTPGRSGHQPERIIPEWRSVGGIPQRIYKLPFANYPDEGFVGATVPELLERIIVGPTAHPYPIATAYDECLTRLGIDPKDKIAISWIPLRQ